MISQNRYNFHIKLAIIYLNTNKYYLIHNLILMKSKDVNTYKKIISEYADKINFYMKENKELRSQIDDVKMTLKINKNLLFSYISSNSEKSEEINVLNNSIKENMKYIELNEKLIEDKRQLGLKLLSFNNQFEEYSNKIREELDKSKEEIFLLKNQLQEKDSEIKLIKRDFNRILNNSVNKLDIYIVEPSKTNLELNNELIAARELLSKISKLLNSEKIKNEKLEKKLKEYEKKSEKEVITINNSKYSQNNQNFINLNESLLSEGDLQISDEDEDGMDLDSPSLKFPDKVKSNYSFNNDKISANNHKIENSPIKEGIPKLNLNIIKNNYQSCADIKVKKNNFNIKDENELQRTIEKLNADLKESKEKLNFLKSKIEKFKASYFKLKEKLRKSENSLKSANGKIDILESQLKKVNVLASTEDRSCMKSSNKRGENYSMNNYDYNYNNPSNEEIDEVMKNQA